MNIRIAICGYGNLGRGVERALQAAGDMEPVAIVTRRPPKTVHPASAIPVLPYAQIDTLRDRVDVLILCSGSAADLPHQTPELAADFNTVDSFDTHGRIPAHFAAVHRSAAASGHLSLISAGWDPGLFSVAPGFCLTPCCRTEPPQPFGAEGSVRGIPMRSAGSPACWTRGSTPSRSPAPWSWRKTDRQRRSPPQPRIAGNALLSPPRTPTGTALCATSGRSPTIFSDTTQR